MKKFILAITMILFTSVLFSQSDEVLDRLYAFEDAKTLETALIVFQASNALTDQATVEDASALLGESKWGQKVLDDGEFITVGGFSQLLLEAFQLDHGVMYNILPVRRYALKEILYMGYILGNPYPGDIMTSFNVIYAVSSMPVDEDINRNYVDTDYVEEVTAEAADGAEVVTDAIEEEDVIEEITEVVPEVEETTEEMTEVVPEEEETTEESAETEEPVIDQDNLVEGAANTEEAGE